MNVSTKGFHMRPFVWILFFVHWKSNRCFALPSSLGSSSDVHGSHQDYLQQHIDPTPQLGDKAADTNKSSASDTVSKLLNEATNPLQLQLIDASTGYVLIKDIQNVSRVEIPSTRPISINIVAKPLINSVAAVKFSNGRVEGAQPFSYCGDQGAGTSFNECSDLSVFGLHEISATALAVGGASLGTTNVSYELVSSTSQDEDKYILALELLHVPTMQIVAKDLQDGMIVTLDDSILPLPSLSIRVVTSDIVSSIRFLSDGHSEGARPFYSCGKQQRKPNVCSSLVVGLHTISIRTRGVGGIVLGKPFSLSFTIALGNAVGEPTDEPLPLSTNIPVALPRAIPALPPLRTPDSTFNPILVNCGGGYYTDLYERRWSADYQYAFGGKTVSYQRLISGTEDDFTYTSERYGSFRYEIELPNADYEIILHFADSKETGERVFNIRIQGKDVFEKVDINVLSGGERNHAVTLETAQVVDEGVLLIEFIKLANMGDPKICGIEINSIGPHLAHAVVGGPYVAVAPETVDGVDGLATVPVSGQTSHTHGPGLRLVDWIWKVNNEIVGKGEETEIVLPRGTFIVTLFVEDDDGNKSAESTTITVLSHQHPKINTLSPSSGTLTGGDMVTISGSGFNFASSETFVKILDMNLASPDVMVVDVNTITFISPASVVGLPAKLSVQTPRGESNTLDFTYIDGDPILFKQKQVMNNLYSPSTVAFGPDEKLYVGTTDGLLYKFTLDDDFNVVETISSSILHDPTGIHIRSILGLTFDPMDTSVPPNVYVSHTYSFHGEWKSSSGAAISGKVSKISGANLDMIDDIVTGLPASDHDHAVNGMEFGNHGELYIQVGGNTNAGVPGRLTANRLQKDNVLSAATLVAYLSDPQFDGFITYDSEDNGNQASGFGVEIFAAGNRNPYDLVLHSNGYLYGTDNGPNVNYGSRSIGCTPGEELPEIEEEDKINLLEYNRWYGHPNRKRGETDPKQCVWRSQNDPSDSDYTAPIAIGTSSMVGICEFQTAHFNSQMRGNLIVSKYKDPLLRVILTPDGRGVIPESNPPIELVGDHTLDVTQAPDGTLVDVRYLIGAIFAYIPVETPTSHLIVKGVFPRRGGVAGGSRLNIYGVNMDNDPSTVSVTVGGSKCPIAIISSKKIVCELPGGRPGPSDVVVSTANESSTFPRGYRYITGLPDSGLRKK